MSLLSRENRSSSGAETGGGKFKQESEMATLRISGRYKGKDLGGFGLFLQDLGLLYDRIASLYAPPIGFETFDFERFYLSKRFNNRAIPRVRDDQMLQLVSVHEGTPFDITTAVAVFGGTAVALRQLASLLVIIRDWNVDHERKKLENQKLKRELSPTIDSSIPDNITPDLVVPVETIERLPKRTSDNLIQHGPRLGKFTRKSVKSRIMKASIRLANDQVDFEAVEFHPEAGDKDSPRLLKKGS